MAFGSSTNVARRLVQDPNTESGRECMDQQDNDGDGKADCEDTDCSTGRMAQICEAMKAPEMRRQILEESKGTTNERFEEAAPLLKVL